MNIKVLRLGTVCVDMATELEGTLTHWLLNMSGGIDYVFQPRGLDSGGQPLSKIVLCRERLNVSEGDFEEVGVPFEILGSKVMDKASGFKGMAVSLVRHINGCLHVDIQPSGVVAGTNACIKICGFDLRECIGEKIHELSSTELETSKQVAPSPTGDIFRKEFVS